MSDTEGDEERERRVSDSVMVAANGTHRNLSMTGCDAEWRRGDNSPEDERH